MPEKCYLYISALQHYAYCPRQFALIHVEQAWAENYFTAHGQILHERVDSKESETRNDIRFERSCSLRSDKYLLTGKLDLLEIHSNGAKPTKYYPVEYKRGKPKTEAWDEIQLCAQVLCLEEMKSTEIHEAALFYWKTRRRKNIIIDHHLREKTLTAIKASHEILKDAVTPKPTNIKSRCKACSLKDLCQPDILRTDHSKNYIQRIFES